MNGIGQRESVATSDTALPVGPSWGCGYDRQEIREEGERCLDEQWNSYGDEKEDPPCVLPEVGPIENNLLFPEVDWGQVGVGLSEMVVGGAAAIVGTVATAGLVLDDAAGWGAADDVFIPSTAALTTGGVVAFGVGANAFIGAFK